MRFIKRNLLFFNTSYSFLLLLLSCPVSKGAASSKTAGRATATGRAASFVSVHRNTRPRKNRRDGPDRPANDDGRGPLRRPPRDAVPIPSTRSRGSASPDGETSANENGDVSEAVLSIMRLSSAHVVPQSLRVFVDLGVPDVLGTVVGEDDDEDDDVAMTMDQILAAIVAGETEGPRGTPERTIQKDALFRILRLLASVGLLRHRHREDLAASVSSSSLSRSSFALTPAGTLLKTDPSSASGGRRSPSWAPCVRHWTERPLWDSWSELSEYVRGAPPPADNGRVRQPAPAASVPTGDAAGPSPLPFDRANGISADEYYGPGRPTSLRHANGFVRLIHQQEIHAVVHEYDWDAALPPSTNRTLVDVGGHNGVVIGAIRSRRPDLTCVCLDLPEVVAVVTRAANDGTTAPLPEGVSFAGGDVLDPRTIPACDAVLLKHVLDRSMWTEEESVRLLRSCRAALKENGIVVVAETVLPDAGDGEDEDDGGIGRRRREMQLVMDVQFLLVGRGSGRTKFEWAELAAASGFKIASVQRTTSLSCSMITLRKV